MYFISRNRKTGVVRHRYGLGRALARASIAAAVSATTSPAHCTGAIQSPRRLTGGTNSPAGSRTQVVPVARFSLCVAKR